MSGNTEAGIVVAGDGASDTKIIKNTVGTDSDAIAAIPNKVGVLLESPAAGKPGPHGVRLDKNLISGNTSDGVQINYAKDVTVSDSIVGTDLAGTIKVPNGGSGISIASSTSVILDGNTVSGNKLTGIVVRGTSAVPSRQVTVTGNFVGTNLAGEVDLGNGGAGVAALDGSSEVWVGLKLNEPGPVVPSATKCGHCNLIAYNKSAGVQVQDDQADPGITEGITVRGNQIYENSSSVWTL